MKSCTEAVPIFADLTMASRAKIDNLTQTITVSKGELVTQPGEPAFLFVVASGSLKTYQLSPSGKEQLLRVAGPGDYEGEGALLGVPNTELFTSTLVESKICLIRRTDFSKLLLNEPAIAIQLLATNAQKNADLIKQTSYLSSESIDNRLSAYLLDLSRVAGKKTFTVSMTWRELANYLGTTPESISRRLKVFCDQGMLKRKNKTVTIVNHDALENLRLD